MRTADKRPTFDLMAKLPEEIRIRITADDKTTFEASAGKQGASLSSWARGHLRAASIRDVQVTPSNALCVGMTVTGMMDDGTKIDWVIVGIARPKKGRGK